MFEFDVESSDGEGDVRVGSTDDGDVPNAQNGPSALLSLMESSFGPVVIALGPTVIYMALSLILFLALRRKLPRVYSPKALGGILAPSELSPELPAGWINWIKPSFCIPDTFVLDKGSLDSFLFLRHLKILSVICVVGICFIWPILLPIHIMGGQTPPFTASLTIPTEKGSEVYYAHVTVSWFFTGKFYVPLISGSPNWNTGFILFMVYRECVYYINIRHAYILSSNYTQRTSSKTILFTSVPPEYLDEKRARKLFGDSSVNCWIPKTTGKLKALIKEREKTATRLEEAEITFIKRCNTVRNTRPSFSIASLYAALTKWTRRTPSLEDIEKGNIHHDARERRESSTQNGPRARVSGSQDDLPGSTHSEYSQPYGRDPGPPDMNGSMESENLQYNARPRHHVFSKFGRRVDTIKWARSHLQSLDGQINELRQEYHGGKRQSMNAVLVEFDSYVKAQAAYQMPAHHKPSQMCQPVIGVRPSEIVWSSLRLKQWQRLIRQYVVLVLLIIGVAVWWFPTWLVNVVTSPDFMEDYSPTVAKLPLIPTNILSGLGRAILLVVLLETVPFFLRACAKFTGEPTLSTIESFVQNRYFVFQVIQVFLAPSVIPQVIRNPTLVLKFYVPKSSEFYYTYILVRCLQASAYDLLQFVELFRHHMKTKGSETPRTCYKRWYKLNVVHWGGIYPVFTNIGVMAICYAFIAPLILAFAATGLCCVYFVYKYNLIYVYDTKTLDTIGLFYPRAVMHLMAGPYLAQIYLIGLFAVSSAWIQMSLMGLLFISTVFIHISVTKAINPLLDSFPSTLSQGEERLGSVEDKEVADAAKEAVGRDYATSCGIRNTMGETLVDARVMGSSGDISPAASDSITFPGREPSQPDNKPTIMRLRQRLALPSVDDLRQIIPQTPAEKEFPDEYTSQRYLPPETWLPKPKLWIPRDDSLMSRQEVALTKTVLPIFDHGAWLDEKGRAKFDWDTSPFKDDLLLYQRMHLML